MTIDELKRAMVEVSELCKKLTGCSECPFDTGKWYCTMQGLPNEWRVDELMEEQANEHQTAEHR